jgi:hypothetical protein
LREEVRVDTQNIVDQVGGLPEADKKVVYRGIIRSMSPQVTSAELGMLLSEKPAAERNKAVAEFKSASEGAGLDRPTQGANDWIWLVVVSAFAVVLVGAFVTLALAVFVAPAQGGVKPELILATFTSVVGFLAGIFVPSPAAKTGGSQKG